MTKRKSFLLLAVSCSGLFASAQDAPVKVQAESDWVYEMAPGEWCGTNQHYMAELAARGGAPPEGVCATNGTCDDPNVRDESIPTPATQVLTFRLRIHVFCENGGSNCAATQADVDLAAARLNADFAPHAIQFTYTTEFVNSTKYRYLNLGSNEPGNMKQRYADSPGTQLNIYVVDTGGGSYGVFPWSAYALTKQGGIVIDDTWFGVSSPLPTILTHEVGHNLGLWHTHHGVSEVEQCGPCYEPAGRSPAEGDVTGDLCEDTNPTPTNSNQCFDDLSPDPCNGIPWGATPWLNYMGYSHTCPIEFTPQQSGRMHCWTGDVLSGWLEQPPPPGISVSPTTGLVTDENGATDSFTVVLDTQPTGLVQIDVSTSDETEGLVSFGLQGPGTLVTITFDAMNWDFPQTVTVTGQEDPDPDLVENTGYTLVTAPASGAPEYSGLDAADVSATNLDNEAPPGITVASIVPGTMDAGSSVNVSIGGSGFQAGVSVSFENGSGPAPSVSNLVWVSSTEITATFSVGNQGPKGVRVWDVRATNPDSSTGVLVDGFTVIK